MRIQETDRILKEARVARQGASQHTDEAGVMSRAWRMISSLPGKIFRRH